MSVFLTHDTRLVELPTGWDGLVSHGTESWTFRTMNLDRVITGTLGDVDDATPSLEVAQSTGYHGVVNGSLTWNVNAQTRTTGNLTWVGHVDDEPDWLNILIQPVFTLTANDGSEWSWAAGVYMPAKPAATHGDGGQVTVNLTMYDRTLALRQSKVDDNHSYPKNTVLSAIAVDMAASAGGYQGVIIPEDITLKSRSPMVWEPGTEYLRIANDALDAAGYFALFADTDGLFRSSPYVRPQDRAVAWQFRDSPTGIYAPEVVRTQDLFNAYNSFTGHTRAEGDTPALSWSEIIPNDHPLSFTSRGRWIDRVEVDVEAADITVLQGMVRRWRDEAMSPDVTVEFEHAPIPLFLNDRVNFRYDGAGIPDVPGVVETMSIPCEPGALWRTTIREVVAS